MKMKKALITGMMGLTLICPTVLSGVAETTASADKVSNQMVIPMYHPGQKSHMKWGHIAQNTHNNNNNNNNNIDLKNHTATINGHKITYHHEFNHTQITYIKGHLNLEKILLDLEQKDYNDVTSLIRHHPTAKRMNNAMNQYKMNAALINALESSSIASANQMLSYNPKNSQQLTKINNLFKSGYQASFNYSQKVGYQNVLYDAHIVLSVNNDASITVHKPTIRIVTQSNTNNVPIINYAKKISRTGKKAHKKLNSRDRIAYHHMRRYITSSKTIGEDAFDAKQQEVDARDHFDNVKTRPARKVLRKARIKAEALKGLEKYSKKNSNRVLNRKTFTTAKGHRLINKLIKEGINGKYYNRRHSAVVKAHYSLHRDGTLNRFTYYVKHVSYIKPKRRNTPVKQHYAKRYTPKYHKSRSNSNSRTFYHQVHKGSRRERKGMHNDANALVKRLETPAKKSHSSLRVSNVKTIHNKQSKVLWHRVVSSLPRGKKANYSKRAALLNFDKKYRFVMVMDPSEPKQVNDARNNPIKNDQYFMNKINDVLASHKSQNQKERDIITLDGENSQQQTFLNIINGQMATLKHASYNDGKVQSAVSSVLKKGIPLVGLHFNKNHTRYTVTVQYQYLSKTDLRTLTKETSLDYTNLVKENNY